jgi:small GTP-binding protein
MEFDHLVKLLVVGDVGVGRSSLMLRFAGDAFDESIHLTIGVDFRVRTIYLGGRRVKLQVWDTQERFRTITPAFYRGSGGVMIVYDASQRASLEHARDWCVEVRRHCRPGVPIVLVGNKSDRADAAVEPAEAGALARELALDASLQTSARTGENVRASFATLARASLHLSGVEVAVRPDDGNWAPEPPLCGYVAIYALRGEKVRSIVRRTSSFILTASDRWRLRLLPVGCRKCRSILHPNVFRVGTSDGTAPPPLCGTTCGRLAHVIATRRESARRQTTMPAV